MHGSAGVHSALAVKRQRRLREQAKRKALERKLSSRTNSMDSMEHHARSANFNSPQENVLATSLGMLHIGVCFLVLGLFLIGSGLLPDDILSWRGGGYWNELVLTGLFVTAIGIFLIILNKIVSRKEEEELQNYVARQLTRSKSGHRLERDSETGCLTTKTHIKLLQKQREGLGGLTPIHSMPMQPVTNIVNNNGHLQKITEEVEFTNSLQQMGENETTSPGSPSETRELIINGRQYSFNSRQY